MHAIEKLYDGAELSMVLIVPDAGTLASFEAGLSSDGLGAILAGLQVKRGQLRMPKWQYEGSTIALEEQRWRYACPRDSLWAGILLGREQ